MSSLIHLSVKSQFFTFDEYFDDTRYGFSTAMERFMKIVLLNLFDIEHWDKCKIRRVISESDPELLFGLQPWIIYRGVDVLIYHKIFLLIDSSKYQFFYESSGFEKACRGDIECLLNDYHEGEDLC
jgi:hypothetical protein